MVIGRPQRDAGFVLRRRSLRSTSTPRSRTACRCAPRAPTSSTSAASRPGPAPQRVDADEEIRRVVAGDRRSWPPPACRSASTPTGPQVAAAALDAGRDDRQRRLRRPRRPGDGRGRARRRLPVDPDALARAQRDDAAARRTTTTSSPTCARELRARVDAAVAAGVDPDALVIDPGPRASPRPAAHNWALLAALDAFGRARAARCWSARRASRSSGALLADPTARRVRSTSARPRPPRITAYARCSGCVGSAGARRARRRSTPRCVAAVDASGVATDATA